MQIHFIVSLKAPREKRVKLKNLANYLREQGHKVSDHRLDDSFKQKPDYNEKELNQYHKSMLNGIKQNDVVIAEISNKSSGLGYEIAVALNERKPILALFEGSPEKNSSLSLKSNPSKLIEVERYDNEQQIRAKTEKFLEKAKTKMDTKFILIISPEIDKYLDWAANERRMHKAQIVRNAVEEKMERDEEYNQFLKDSGLA